MTKIYGGTPKCVTYYFEAPLVIIIAKVNLEIPSNAKKIPYLVALLGPLQGTLVETYCSKGL
jgi:hypothetical protein